MKLRPKLNRFARIMELMFQEQDEERGHHNGRHSGAGALLSAVQERVKDLDYAVCIFEMAQEKGKVEDKHIKDVSKRAADVANFAMLIADICYGLDK